MILQGLACATGEILVAGGLLEVPSLGFSVFVKLLTTVLCSD